MMILPPPTTDIPRFLSLSLPEYRYVPKYLPHPFRSDNGHQHMKNIRSGFQNRKEEEMLDTLPECAPHSRLACQLVVHIDHDEIEVHMPC